MRLTIRRVAITAIFAGLIFVSKVFVPTPFDKALILPQVTLLTLSSLILPKLGSTTTATISGLLMTAWRPSFAPLSLLISILLGVSIDLTISVFKAKNQNGDVRAGRLLAATSVGTALTGFVSYYVTVHALAVMPSSPIVDAMILLGGIVSGSISGLVALVIWKRIKHIV